jgi:hypothetical protein
MPPPIGTDSPVMPLTMHDTQADTRYPGEVEELLHHLDSWPYLHIERRTDCAILRTRDLVVGTLNLVMRALSVNVPPDAVGPRLESDPLLRRTTGGVSVHVTDIESRTAAEALVRWRVGLERFAWQLRAASP